jgi:hypothetical protein
VQDGFVEPEPPTAGPITMCRTNILRTRCRMNPTASRFLDVEL